MAENGQILTTPIPDDAGAIVPPGARLGLLDHYGAYIPRALEAIENRLPLVFSLGGIVGYIVISAFGKMDSLRKYLGYLSILFFGMLSYRLLKKEINNSTAVIFLLVAIIFSQAAYIIYIKGFWGDFLNFLHI